MTTTKRRIEVTDDNYADYFNVDIPNSIVAKLTIGPHGIDPTGPEVAMLRKVINRVNMDQSETEFVLSNHDAVVTLEQAAGWPDMLDE